MTLKDCIVSQLFEHGLQVRLDTSYQDLLGCLDMISARVQDNSEALSKLDITNTDDREQIKDKIQKNKVSS